MKKEYLKLDYKRILEFAEKDHQENVKKGCKYAVLRDQYEKKNGKKETN